MTCLRALPCAHTGSRGLHSNGAKLHGSGFRRVLIRFEPEAGRLEAKMAAIKWLAGWLNQLVKPDEHDLEPLDPDRGSR